ncbi:MULTISPECIES: DUF6046 domain-containing protein [Cloacibacterium]|uniref:DUF6046 domain-containing protein n=1 Tax=Cloacibacterium TaxID=501783 RepID=UPI00352F633B
MEFNEKSILFASLLGSKVAQQIPRFETVQNEIGKRVLPPISFLPFKNNPVKINEPEGNFNPGELWMADAPKSESEQFFPFTFIDGKNRYTLPYEPMISISSANNIVERTVAKAGNDAQYEGTVKERWSRGDWEIKITGVLIGSILTGDVSQCFPKSDFEKLRDILQLRKNWKINCSPLELLGINSIVIYDMNFPFTKGENVQAYEITAKSDFDFNLLLEEKDVLQS